MRSPARRPLSYANVVATLALFLVLAGGTAYATRHYLITRTNQIKPSVRARLRGAKGPAGTPGTLGAPGATGASGVSGPVGVTGPTGPGEIYAGRVTVALSAAQTTFLTIPGIAHVNTLDCSGSDANAQLFLDAGGTWDEWDSGDSHYSTGWSSVGSTPAATSGTVWHIGTGSGASAEVVTVTVSWAATGSDCVFQGTAEAVAG
jgi:hypothetical protein